MSGVNSCRKFFRAALIVALAGHAAPDALAAEGVGTLGLRPAPGSRVVHVSASDGDDRHDGASPQRAVRSVQRGVSLLRDGQPDWLLFKRGDRWQASLGKWTLSGRSAREPLVIGSYGADARRPVLATGDEPALQTTGGKGRPREINHLVLIGLHFVADARDPASPRFRPPTPVAGIRWLRGTRGVHVEDCVFERYAVGVVFQDVEGLGVRNVRLRRSQVIDSYGVAGQYHSQGLYAEKVDGLVIEECLFDHNGWAEHPALPGAEPTKFNHNLYIQTDCKNVELRDSVVLRASSHGIQLRPGGIIEGNVFARNPISILLGGPGRVAGNVILEGNDIGAGLRGWGIDLNDAPPGSQAIEGNLIGQLRSASPDNAMAIKERKGPIYRGNVVFEWPQRGDPWKSRGALGRSLAAYSKRSGGAGSFEDLVAQLRAQSGARWRPEYTARAIAAYFREGFAP